MPAAAAAIVARRSSPTCVFNAGAGDGYFRLLETTRVYALSRLADSGEMGEYSRRHAEYYKGLLERIENESKKRSVPPAHVDNVRAALEWCFGVNGSLPVGVGLAAEDHIPTPAGTGPCR